jgi:hypothetical protein
MIDTLLIQKVSTYIYQTLGFLDSDTLSFFNCFHLFRVKGSSILVPVFSNK